MFSGIMIILTVPAGLLDHIWQSHATMHRWFSIHELELAFFGEDLAGLYPCCTAMHFPSGSTHFLAEFWGWVISRAKLLATLISLWNLQDWENSFFVFHDSTKPWLNSFLLLCHISPAFQTTKEKNPPDRKDLHQHYKETDWGPYFSAYIKLLFCFPTVALSFIWVALMFP